MRPYNKSTGESVEADEIVTKAMASSGELVELTDDEIAAITGDRDGQAPIETFIPLASLLDGTYVVESIQQIRAPKMKVGSRKVENVAGGKALNLLLQAMATEQVAALVKVALRSAARYAAILPDGRLAILAFAEQVRQPLPLPGEPSEAEVQMALALVRSVGVSKPVLTDTTGAALQAYVDSKATGAEPVEVVEVASTEPVIDLMAALAASLGIDTPESEDAAVAAADEAIDQERPEDARPLVRLAS